MLVSSILVSLACFHESPSDMVNIKRGKVSKVHTYQMLRQDKVLIGPHSWRQMFLAGFEAWIYGQATRS